jgi:hypothetical protein
MSAKKKKPEDIDTLIENDVVLGSLKERYFKLLKKEDIGKTPQVTELIDKIELAVMKRKEEIINDHS